jgi:site-specific DNA-methyltransferase (adenine-specific)
MEDTLDVWEIPPESATRVGHPAPFPIELPSRLIDLYTYRGDLVLDPFVGSGSTAIAAVRRGRHYVGYDLDETYIRLAERRLFEESQAEPAVAEGRSARDLARTVLAEAGFTDVHEDQRLGGGVSVTFAARDQRGGSDNLWKALGKAAVVREVSALPLVVLTTGLPGRANAGSLALRQVCGPGKPIHSVIDLLEPSAVDVVRKLRFPG